MNNYKNNDFVKRVRVKGYPRTNSKGNTYMVSPHFRVVRTIRCQNEKILPRRKLI